MFWKHMLQYIRWIWERFDTVLALLFGVVCSVLGLLNVLPSPVIASATLATLAILAFSLIRDRDDRTQLLRQIVSQVGQSREPDLDAIFYRPVDVNPALMLDSRLVTILDKIVDDPSMSLFAIFSSEHRNSAFLQKLRLHRRSTMLYLTTNAQERDTTEQLLERELLASVFVAKNELSRVKKK